LLRRSATSDLPVEAIVRLDESAHGREASLWRGHNATVTAKEKVDRLSLLVDRSMEVMPFALNGNVRLVSAPGSTNGSRESVPAPLIFRDDVPANTKLDDFSVEHPRRGDYEDQLNSTTVVEWHSTYSNNAGMARKILKNTDLNSAMRKSKLRAVD
jgi:hypothetical protein